MNLILFDHQHTVLELSEDDPRARHVLGVLRMRRGDSFDVGVANGPLGKATIEAECPYLKLSFQWLHPSAPPAPIVLLAGLPRPQTARKILKDVTSLGVDKICFFCADKGEPSYRSSKLWNSEEWRRLLREGAEQAFVTDIPEVLLLDSLQEALHHAKSDAQIALDNYEATAPLADLEVEQDAATLAVGSERGWSAAERDLLRASGFRIAHLGERVLRTEVASIVGVALLAAKLGHLGSQKRAEGQ